MLRKESRGTGSARAGESGCRGGRGRDDSGTAACKAQTWLWSINVLTEFSVNLQTKCCEPQAVPHEEMGDDP